jgi:hypothetical protein
MTRHATDDNKSNVSECAGVAPPTTDQVGLGVAVLEAR